MKQLYTFLMVFAALGLQAQIINIPDAAFKAKLLQSSPSVHIAAGEGWGVWLAVDANQNGEIEVSEAQAVTRLYIPNSGISSLEGLQHFTNLTELVCNNNNLTALDVSALLLLNHLNCSYNQLQQLDTQGLHLFSLYAQFNQIQAYTIQQQYFDYLDLSNNQLTSLHIPNTVGILHTRSMQKTIK